jgi:hypothetical protein
MWASVGTSLAQPWCRFPGHDLPRPFGDRHEVAGAEPPWVEARWLVLEDSLPDTATVNPRFKL